MSDYRHEQREDAVVNSREPSEHFDAGFVRGSDGGEAPDVGFDVGAVKLEQELGNDDSGFNECYDSFMAEQADLGGLPVDSKPVVMKKSDSDVGSEPTEEPHDLPTEKPEVPDAPEVQMPEPSDDFDPSPLPNPDYQPPDGPPAEYPDHVEDPKNYDPMAPPPMYYPPMGFAPMEPSHPGFYNLPPPMYPPPMMPNGAPAPLFYGHYNSYGYSLQRAYSNVSVGSAQTGETSEHSSFYPLSREGGGFDISTTPTTLKDDAMDSEDNDEPTHSRRDDLPQPPSYNGSMMPMMYNEGHGMGMYNAQQQPPPPMNMYEGPQAPQMEMDYMGAPPPPAYYYPPPPMDQMGQHMGEFQNFHATDGMYMHPPPMTMTLQEQQATWGQQAYPEPEETTQPPRKNAKKGRVAKAPKPRKTTTRKRGGKRKNQNRDADAAEEVPPPLVELPTGFEQVLQRAATGPTDPDVHEPDVEVENNKPQAPEDDTHPEANDDSATPPPDADARESSYDPPRRRDYRRCETKVMLQTVDGHLFNKYFEEEDIRDFARRFKTLRCEFGFSQADVGAALGRRYGSDFSQTTISRFEGLVLSHSNMCKLRPPIEQWIADVQTALDSGIPIEQLRRACKGGDFWPSETPPPLVNASLVPPLRKRRKRTSLEAAQRLALESYFEVNLRPDNNQMSEISRTLDLGFDVVRVWFCNRRQKARKDDAKIKARAARANGTMHMDMPTPSPTPSPSVSMQDVNEQASNENYEDDAEMPVDEEPSIEESTNS